MPPRAAAALVGVLLLSLVAASNAAAFGELTQLPGTLGCTKNLSTFDGCAAGTSLDGAFSVVVSADGNNAYVASPNDDAIAIFARDATSGSMLQKANPNGCISPDGSGGTCRTANELTWNAPDDIVVTPDGKNVYLSWFFGILVFNRDPVTGDLTQATGTTFCISETDRSGQCTVGKALQGQRLRLAVSPDSKNVYTAAASKVGAFSRDATTGQLTFLNCFGHAGAGGCTSGKGLENASAVAVSPDGKGVYASSPNGVAILDRDQTTGALTQQSAAGAGCVSNGGAGGCAMARHFGDVSHELAFSPLGQGDHLYVGADRTTFAIFDRDPATNALTQKVGTAGCVTHSDVSYAADCTIGRDFVDHRALVVTPDGKSLYVSSEDFGIAVFDRDPVTGAVTQKAGVAGCLSSDPDWYQTVTDDRRCSAARQLFYANDLAVSPDGGGTRLYLAANFNDALASIARNTDSGGDGGGGDDGGGDDGTGSGGGTGDPPLAPIETLVPPPPAALPPRPIPPPRPSRLQTVIISARPGNGTVDVHVTTDGAGRITVDASAPVNTRFLSGLHARLAATRKLRIARATKNVTRAGTFKLVLRPTAKARRILRKKGRIKATLRIGFKPANGTPATTRRKSVTFKLRRR